MKSGVIRIRGELWDRVRKQALSSTRIESVAFLTATFFEAGDKVVFLAHDLVPAFDRDYLHRSDVHLEVSPLYVSRALNQAEEIGDAVIMGHSHPFDTGVPAYSMSDNYGEARTSETIARCLVGNPPVGSLLFGQRHVNARVWTGKSRRPIPCDVMVLADKGLAFHHKTTARSASEWTRVDRQVRALGTSGQDQLETLTVGIVGLGGTGSNVAEQLVRMGVKNFALVDLDTFHVSNWSRLYGSTWKDTDRNKTKVNIVRSHIKRINPAVTCEAISLSVLNRKVLAKLSGCDVVFSCLDRHAPRAVLNELSYQCFVPVIDVGIGISRLSGKPLAGTIRATVIGPDLPCLFCLDIVRPDHISAEHLAPNVYAERRAEGYVPELGQQVPSVIAYTTAASSLGVMLLIDMISGDQARPTSTVLLDIATKKTMRLAATARADCVCKKRLGKGWRLPFSVAD